MVDFFQPTLEDAIPEIDDAEPEDIGVEHTIESNPDEER